MNRSSLVPSDDFSLMHGGLLYRLVTRWATPSQAKRIFRLRILALPILAWAPPLLLCLAQGIAFGGPVRVPFFSDFAVHVRFLFALPLLLWAEDFVDPWISQAVHHFLDPGLVPDSELPAFRRTIRQAERARDALGVEPALLCIAYLNIFAGTGLNTIGATSWRSISGPASWWYEVVSIPISLFVLLRWLWRFAVWCWMMRRLSRLRLGLVATHPDRAGGLAFVTVAHARFALTFLAASATIAAQLGERVVYGGQKLSSFEVLVAGFVVLSFLFFLLPLLTFSPLLLVTKHTGLLEYGAFSLAYDRSFRSKWIGPAKNGPEALGSQDIQALADLGGSFARIIEMRASLWNRVVIVPIAVATIVPMLPLILAEVPVTHLLKSILKMLS